MLVTYSQQVNTDLRAHTALTNLLTKGEHGIRPLKGSYKDGEDLVTYYIAFQGRFTKDGSKSWQLVVQSWADTYDDSLAIADAVADAIGASANYYEYVSAIPKFTEEGIIYTEQIFEIQK